MALETTLRKLRSSRRLKTFLPADLRVHGHVLPIHVLDVSAGGARIHCWTKIAVSTPVHLIANGMDIAAEVHWAEDRMHGLRFIRNLAVDEVDRIAAGQGRQSAAG